MSEPLGLPALLAALDPQAPLVERHLWLIRLFDWLRGDARSVPAAQERVTLFLDAMQSQPALEQRFRLWWQALVDNVDSAALLADHGFAWRHAFLSELADRLRLKLLPDTPETHDATELFGLALPKAFDALWLAALDDATLARLAALLHTPRPPGLSLWQHTLLEAATFCTSQIRATGFSPELRLRMTATARKAEPFHQLTVHFESVRSAFLACMASGGGAGDVAHNPALQQAVQHFREQLDACRQAASSVYTHLDEHGISVNLVFRLRQLRERVLRMRMLLDCLASGHTASSTARLMAHLVNVTQERHSVRALISANSSMLAAKVAERSAEVGAHYITRNAAEYRDMLRKAAGGGALMAFTTVLKLWLYGLALSAFWGGFWAGVNYSLSFVLVQLLHFTVATKQPAMTAPAMAAKLKDMGEPGALPAFVDEVTHLVRSQVAAVIGNVALVFPAVLLLCAALQGISGHNVLDAKGARHVFETLTLLGPTALFAAFTGVLLFASSIIAGWFENWFVLHRLDSAMRYNPRMTAVLGKERAERWSRFTRANISGFAANVSLGMMLGLVPAFAAFFGLGLEVRHVTLSAGQLAAACAALGWEVWREPALWWGLAALPVTGALNVGVSFYLAFRLALRAHNVTGVDRANITRAVLARWRAEPLRFFWPGRASAHPPT